MADTGYKVLIGGNSVDLVYFFAPGTTTTANSGYKPNQTNYSGQNDLSKIFAPYVAGQAKAVQTYYLYKNASLVMTDLNTLYCIKNVFSVSSPSNVNISYYTDASYNYIAITNSSETVTGTVTLTVNSIKTSISSVSYIAVGGGGAGGGANFGNGNAGGGGAGEVIKGTIATVNNNISFNILVGVGGTASAESNTPSYGLNGGTTNITYTSTITAYGGGAGGYGYNQNVNINGSFFHGKPITTIVTTTNYGSGGGGGTTSDALSFQSNGGYGIQSYVSNPPGPDIFVNSNRKSSGGPGGWQLNVNTCGGGGGGANGSGSNNNSGNYYIGGKGGIGYNTLSEYGNSIKTMLNLVDTFLAGGGSGGGGQATYSISTGGSGGGGNGGFSFNTTYNSPTNGTPKTGGGGGGGVYQKISSTLYSRQGGSGGSGCVILVYPISSSNNY
jgi:hypothetical protein